MKPCTCPHCGQRMLMHFGIRFEPRRAEILGMIKDVTKGRGGIAMDSLVAVFCPGRSTRQAEQTMRVHISEINSMLISTDWRVVYDFNTRLYSLKECAGSATTRRRALTPEQRAEAMRLRRSAPSGRLKWRKVGKLMGVSEYLLIKEFKNAA